MIHHAARALAAVCDVLVVAATHEGLLPVLPAGIYADVVRDTAPFEGPLAGLSDALARIRTRLAVVAGGDMPALSVQVLRLMISEAAKGGTELVVLNDGKAPRPLPCVVSTAARVRIREAVDGGERRLKSLLDLLSVRVIPAEEWRRLDPTGGSLRDVDLPGDLS